MSRYRQLYEYAPAPDFHGDEDLIDECPICSRDYFNCKCTIEELEDANISLSNL